MASTTLDGTGTPFVIPQNNTRQVNDGDELLLLGTIQDDGTILVNGTGGPFQSLPTEAQLALVFLETPTVTLDGGGTVVLVGTDPANIVGSSPATETLVNAATIVGTGFIGGPIHTIDATTTLYPLNLVNEAGGVIDATGSLGASGSTQATFNPGQLLDIENGGSALVNSGLIEATGIGGMFIEAETIDQSGGGTLRAAGAGVEISLSNAGDSPIAIIGGTLEATDGGVLSISRFANITLDGSQSPLTIGVGSTLSLSMIDAAIDMLGTIQNQGTLSGGSPLILTTPTVTLTGGGTVRDPQIFGHGGSLATLVNGDTLIGSGHIGASNFIYLAPVVDNGVQQFGSAPVALVNLAGGVIDAIGTLNSGSNDIGRGSVAGLLLFNDGATSINDGLIEATGIQGLDIDTGTLDQSGGGTLLASGSGVAVYLQSVDVIGGEILATDGGAIVFNAGANTLAATAGAPIAINAGGVLAVVNSGVANVSAATLTLAGSAVVNAGTLIDGATLILASPTVTFSGGGSIKLPGQIDTAGSAELINSDNTVTGAGDIASATLRLVNAATGIIAGVTLDIGGTVANTGLLENVSAGAGIPTTIDNTGGGTLLASGTSGVVTLYDADIVGGTLAATGGGFFQLIALSQVQQGTTLDGRGTPVTIDAGVVVQDLANNNSDSGLSLLGTIDLLGTILGALDLHNSAPFALPNAGVLEGSGMVSGYVANTGTLLALGGTLAVSNDVDGTGSIAISPGAAFLLGGESGESVNFGGTGQERLILNTPSAFSGTLVNLGLGDAIDLGTSDIQSAVVIGNTLNVTMTNSSTLAFAVAGLPSGATLAPVVPSSQPEIFSFSYTGAAGSAYPGDTAQGTGSFTVLTSGGSALSLADIVGFTLTLTVVSSGANGSQAGTDVITYTQTGLTSFGATLNNGTLSSLALDVSDGTYNHFTPVVTYEQFQISSLAAGGAASEDTSAGRIVTQGSVAVTPQGALVSELVVQCFAEGTRIASPGGERAVQDLAVGDRVLTASGQARPIVWIGRRRVDLRRHPEPWRVRPVRIAAGAFGPNRPHTDLLLSPDHAVLAGDVLIPVKYLVNGTSIAPAAGTDEVSYYHIELASHDVLLAEGLPVESYLDTGRRGDFANNDGPVTLHPVFAADVWEARGCAPLVVTGPGLDAVRLKINTRPQTDEHALRRVS